MGMDQRYAAVIAAVRTDIEDLQEEQKKLYEELNELKKLLKVDIKDTSTLEPIL